MLNNILTLRHRLQPLRQRLLLARIAPLHDIIVLHPVDAGAVPPVGGGELADIADPALREGRRHQLDYDAAGIVVCIGGEVQDQQIAGCDRHPFLWRRLFDDRIGAGIVGLFGFLGV